MLQVHTAPQTEGMNVIFGSCERKTQSPVSIDRSLFVQASSRTSRFLERVLPFWHLNRDQSCSPNVRSDLPVQCLPEYVMKASKRRTKDGPKLLENSGCKGKFRAYAGGTTFASRTQQTHKEAAAASASVLVSTLSKFAFSPCMLQVQRANH